MSTIQGSSRGTLPPRAGRAVESVRSTSVQSSPLLCRTRPLVGQFDGFRAVAQARVVGRLPGGVAQGVVELHLDLRRLLQGDPQDRALEALAIAVEGAALLLQLLLALLQFGGAVVQLALFGEQAFEIAFGQLQQVLQLVDAGQGPILARLGAAALDVGEELLLRFKHAAAIMDFPQLPVDLAQLLVELLHTVVVRALDPLRGAADVEQGGGGAGFERGAQAGVVKLEGQLLEGDLVLALGQLQACGAGDHGTVGVDGDRADAAVDRLRRGQQRSAGEQAGEQERRGGESIHDISSLGEWRARDACVRSLPAA
ncbi:Uncharacterised protein [Pseudomonas aeruginosa]|nr:Uncharacterised protein [Pseudomonas aeruginosa]